MLSINQLVTTDRLIFVEFKIVGLIVTMSSESKRSAMSSLEQLKASGTLVVADTGDFEVGCFILDNIILNRDY